MLKATDRAKGGQPYQQKSTDSNVELVETLSDLGLDLKTSMIAQKLAELPQEQFEQVREVFRWERAGTGKTAFRLWSGG